MASWTWSIERTGTSVAPEAAEQDGVVPGAAPELGVAQHPLLGEPGLEQCLPLGQVVRRGRRLDPLHQGGGEEVGSELALSRGPIAASAVGAEQRDADVERPAGRRRAVLD